MSFPYEQVDDDTMLDDAKGLEDGEWHEVGPGTPCGAWLETRLEGESGTNVCACRVIALGEEPEWVEKSTGRTTITHHSFAAPSHWRWPAQ